MMRRAILLGLVLVGGSWSLALGGPIPSPRQGVTISTTVSRDAGTGIFTYRYRITNPPTNDGQIWHIQIEVTRGSGETVLSRDGLVNGPRYKQFSSEDAFQTIPMVPVGIDGPQGWTTGLGYDDQTPAHGFASWGAVYDPSLILPGGSLEGFRLTSYGLPGIRNVIVRPDIDENSLPEEFTEAEKIPELEARLMFRGKTVGPKAPPQPFVPLEFLNYLIALLHDSRQQGWIRLDGIHQSLLAKLLAAKRSLEAGRVQPAAGELRAFVNEVQAVSCPELTCLGNKPLTSEAYALLFFNGQYLFERLPAPGAR